MAQEAHVGDILKLVNEAKALAAETKALALGLAGELRQSLLVITSDLQSLRDSMEKRLKALGEQCSKTEAAVVKAPLTGTSK
jgi:hypothetical protein